MTQQLGRFFPKSWLASRTIIPAFQELAVDDRVPDYGAKDDYFDVVMVEEPRALVYESVRYGTKFSWAILLHERQSEGSSEGVETIVHDVFYAMEHSNYCLSSRELQTMKHSSSQTMKHSSP